MLLRGTTATGQKPRMLLLLEETRQRSICIFAIVPQGICHIRWQLWVRHGHLHCTINNSFMSHALSLHYGCVLCLRLLAKLQCKLHCYTSNAPAACALRAPPESSTWAQAAAGWQGTQPGHLPDSGFVACND